MSEDTKDAAIVMDGTLSLVRALLLRHETLVIAEFREVIEAKNHELKLIYQQRDEEHGKAQSQAAENAALKAEIAALKAELEAFKNIANAKPLDAEAAKVLHDNLWELYER